MRITNMKIGGRLGAGFGFLVLLLVAMAVLGITRLSMLDAQMDDVVSDKYPKTVLAMTSSNTSTRLHVRRAICC
jgi:methyl-accepting chemotaxis protein